MFLQRKIALSTLWQLASQVTMAALSILTVKFVAVGLSKELAGNYNSAYGFLQLFGILADFGLYAVAVREVSRAGDRKAEVLGALLILRTIILFLSLGSAIVIVWLMPMWHGTPLPIGVTIAAFVPFFTLLAGIIRTVFQVEYRMHCVFIAEVAQRILTASAIGLFIFFGVRSSDNPHVYEAFLGIGGAGALLLFILSLLFARRSMPLCLRWNNALLKKLIVAAAPFGLAYLCMALYRQFDVTLIALLRPDFELQNAYYGFVQRMADMGYLIPTFLLNSILPLLSERHEHGEATESLLGKTLFAILICSSISLLFSIFWARPLIALLTTNAYLSTATQSGSDSVLRLIGFSMFFNGFILYGFYVLLTRHQWKRLVTILLFGGCLSLTSNIILIPQEGFMGAATTSVIVHTALGFLLLAEGLRAMPASFDWNDTIRWIGFAMPLAIFLFFSAPLLTSELKTIVGLGAATLLMGILAWVLGLDRGILRGIQKENLV
ncbi:MAG: oligosaccharide flippase family protein [Candidatus Peribacteraceae bacterium]|nr:oligosaccharide flippase family protein [Candidatus Peribacteraceae bacterium]